MPSSFVDYVVHDLLGGMPGVRARAMFGGHGVYRGEVMFGIIVDDELYYKVGGTNRAAYEARGSEPFRYAVKGRKPVTMSFWKVPAEVLDDRETMEAWTDAALRVARAAKRRA
jgi:DNA transformation protein